MPSLIWLDEVGPDDRTRVGGKAFVLGRLRQAGFAVPDGFVIPADARLAPDESQAIVNASRQLTGASVAVRSSSGAEDGEQASFAGQYVTILDVRGEPALTRAILDCRAGTARAEVYASTLGVEGDRVAVLVQQFVEPRAAGVVFTRDPQDGAAMIVEAHAGRGEAVVSGTVRPARYRVMRETGAMTREGPDGVLSPEDLRELISLAQRLEQHLGSPQDIEWAWGDGGLVVLQARPITVSAEEGVDPRLRRLTRANVGEVLPGPVTPLAWSVLGAFLEHAFRQETARLAILPEDAPAFLVLHHRRLYLNLDLCIEVAARMPGVSTADVEKLILGKGATRGHEPRRAEHRPLRTLTGLAALALSLPAKIQAADREVAGLAAAERVAAADAATLVAMMDVVADAGRRIAATHVNTSGASAVAMALLERLIALDGRGDPRERTARLLAGLDDVESVAPAIALETLAARARDEDDWREWLTREASTVAADFAVGRGPTGLVRELTAFLVRFGHRGLSEGDVSARAWDEDPTPVLASLRVLLGSARSPGFGPRARAEVRRADEEALLCRAGLGVRPLARWLMAAAQTWVRRREHTKSLAVATVRHARRVLQAATAVLVLARRLPDAALADFLTFDEIRNGLLGASLPVAEARRRKRRHEAESRLPAPREVDLSKSAESSPGPVADGSLRGIGVSPGLAVGRARVATGGIPDLEPGEILVAPVLDAAMAPLLATAAGAVVEIGGILSHGSVVAREMGVPCVVDVREATQRIKTGETIIVDGGSGLVRRVLEEEADSSRPVFPSARPVDDTAVGLHPLEDHAQARESVYLNMRDPARGLAIVFSMGVRPGGRGEALITLSLPDDRVLFGFARGRAQVDDDGFGVGGFRLSWRPLRLEIDADVAPHEATAFPPGPVPLLLMPRTGHLRGALTFEPTTSAIDFCETLPEEAREWLRPLGSHHVEQSGRWRGDLDLDGATLPFAGRGSRDHSWGRRDWEAADHWRLFMAPIDDRLAAHALVVSSRGRLVSGGIIWRDGEAELVSRVEYAARRDARGRVVDFELELITPRGPARLLGRVEQTVSIPVQPELRLWRHLAGRPYRLVLHENFTRYEMDGVVGHGMAEFTERPD
jgi:rifampicin phosphotransferase